MKLVDSHCHLDDASFDADRDTVLLRARTVGVIAQILPAVAAHTFSSVRHLCDTQSDLYAAFGLHPMYVDRHDDADLDAVARYAEHPRCVAIGECGLDAYVAGLDLDRQRTLFDAQLRLAKSRDLPLILHGRRAFDEVILRIRRVGGLRGVVHSFAGSAEQARQLAQLGFLIGLGGPLTYPRAQRLRTLAATVPIEQLLLESDAPDQPNADARGQRNEPASIRTVAETLAELRGESVEAVAAATTANAIRLFRLDQFGVAA